MNYWAAYSNYIISMNIHMLKGIFRDQTDNQPTVGTNVTRDTQHTGSICNVIHCAYWLYKCSLLNNNLKLTVFDLDPSGYR